METNFNRLKDILAGRLRRKYVEDKPVKQIWATYNSLMVLDSRFKGYVESKKGPGETDPGDSGDAAVLMAGYYVKRGLADVMPGEENQAIRNFCNRHKLMWRKEYEYLEVPEEISMEGKRHWLSGEIADKMKDGFVGEGHQLLLMAEKEISQKTDAEIEEMFSKRYYWLD